MADELWTLEIESYFIKLISQESILYNPKHPRFKSRNLKRAKYEEILINLKSRWPNEFKNVEINALLYKFHNLKSYYRRAKKEELIRQSEAEGATFRPRWEHYQRMRFLDDSFIPNPSESNLDVVSKITEKAVSPSSELPALRSLLEAKDILSSSEETPSACTPSQDASFSGTQPTEEADQINQTGFSTVEIRKNDVSHIEEVEEEEPTIKRRRKSNVNNANQLSEKATEALVAIDEQKDLPPPPCSDSLFCSYLLSLLKSVHNKEQKLRFHMNVINTFNDRFNSFIK